MIIQIKYTMREFKLYCSEEQTKQINELLGENRETYSLADVFNILPMKIRWGDRSGYLKISKFDIVYASLELEKENKVAMISPFLTTDRNIYDAFIDILRILKRYEGEIQILEK